MILVGALIVFLAAPVVGLQPRSVVHRPKGVGTRVSQVPEVAATGKIGNGSASGKMVSISAGAGLGREDDTSSINSVWTDTLSQAVHVDARRSAAVVESALYLGQAGSNVSGTLLAIEWTIIVVLLIVIAFLIRNIVEKRSVRLSEEHRLAKDQTAHPAREPAATWPFGMLAVRLQRGNPEHFQPRVDLPSSSLGTPRQNAGGSPILTRGSAETSPHDRCEVVSEVLQAKVAALAAPEVERRLQDIETSVADAEDILVSGGGASGNLWRVLKALRSAGGLQESASGCRPASLSPPHPLNLPAVAANCPPFFERQPNSRCLAESSSLSAEFEGPSPDIDVANVASTVVTLRGNPSVTLNGVYGFQGWLCQRPVFANEDGGVLYHDGEHWKARAEAVPPDQAAAAVSFAAWIRSSEALPPEGDWLNFAQNGNVSSITHVSVSFRDGKVAGPFSPPLVLIQSPQIRSDLAREGAHYPPSELMVKSPMKQVAFAGRYKLVFNQNPNGYPLWKHSDHERYLYSGVNGKWHFGANPEKEKGFFCSRGFVLHPSRHNGLMPSQLPPAEWKAYNGITHETDPSIEVKDVPPPLTIPQEVVLQETKADCLPSCQAPDFAAWPDPPCPLERAPSLGGPEPPSEPAALTLDRAGWTGRPPRPEQSGHSGFPGVRP